jgi:hypothetical protein
VRSTANACRAAVRLQDTQRPIRATRRYDSQNGLTPIEVGIERQGAASQPIRQHGICLDRLALSSPALLDPGDGPFPESRLVCEPGIWQHFIEAVFDAAKRPFARQEYGRFLPAWLIAERDKLPSPSRSHHPADSVGYPPVLA